MRNNAGGIRWVIQSWKQIEKQQEQQSGLTPVDNSNISSTKIFPPRKVMALMKNPEKFYDFQKHLAQTKKSHSVQEVRCALHSYLHNHLPMSEMNDEIACSARNLQRKVQLNQKFSFLASYLGREIGTSDSNHVDLEKFPRVQPLPIPKFVKKRPTPRRPVVVVPPEPRRPVVVVPPETKEKGVARAIEFSLSNTNQPYRNTTPVKSDCSWIVSKSHQDDSTEASSVESDISMDERVLIRNHGIFF